MSKATPKTRSQQMSRIRGRDTVPELVIRKGLWAAGLRYRVNYRTPGGRADLAVVRDRFALFVDGCFWHGCPEHYVRPRTRHEFWDAKLLENVMRDRRQTLSLEGLGWRVLRIWEHEVTEEPLNVISRVLAALRSGGHGRRKDWRVVSVSWPDGLGVLEHRHLEDLRKAAVRKIEEGPRSTTKVGRVQRVAVLSDDV